MAGKMERSGASRAWSLLLVLVLVFAALAIGAWLGEGRGVFSSGEQVSAREFGSAGLSAERAPGFFGAGVNPLLEDRLVEVVASAMPAVVSVFAEKSARPAPEFPFGGPFFMPPPGRFGPRLGLGSGVIVREDGVVLTNNHVIEGADSIRIMLDDKRKFQARVLGTDPETDLAVLQIEADDLPAISLGDSDQVQVGQMALAIGSPFGLSQTVTMGIISARGRSRVGIASYEDWIQTDAAINPGNSGGALINLRGELIGINTAIFSRTGGYMGVGFAIPVNMARGVMEDLIERGEVRRGFLGVIIQDLAPGLAEQFGIEKAGGALVAGVQAGSAAERAGLLPGDVVTALNGDEIGDSTRLRNMIAQVPPGDKIELSLIRDKKTMKTTARLEARPPDLARRGATPTMPRGRGQAEFAGMRVAELTPELADHLGLERSDRGVAVTAVQPGGRADRAGIRPGDVIMKFDQTRVRTISDFKAAAKKADGPVLIHLRRGEWSQFTVLAER